MNQVEMMQGRFEALALRLGQVEERLAALSRATADGVLAQQLIQEMGFSLDCLFIPSRVLERRRLAENLRRRGWSQARIARVLNCCEKTVERWTGSPDKSQNPNPKSQAPN
jgi:DNA-binding NarL/FixJ family response regulator